MTKVLIQIILTLLLLLPRTADARKYRWPLDAPPAMTSSFGEYRPGHFHAGIDLKTWGRVGYKARALEDGYVWRIRTSPWGYGKAVYLRLRDGNFAVYAHLSRFAPRIKRLVEEAQRKKRLYSVDLYLQPDQIPVRRGEVMGLSGRSATKFPHLHFELRDSEGRPINPLRNGIFIEDSLPPIVSKISLSPVGSGSRVNGSHGPTLIPLTWDRKKRKFLTAERPVISGRIAVGISTYDQADAADNRFAPYEVNMSVDGRALFSVRYEIFPYDKTHQIDLDRDFKLHRRGHGVYQNLFRAHGNELPFYGDHLPGDGMLHCGIPSETEDNLLAKGMHTIEIQISDAYGNTATAELTVLVNIPPDIPSARAWIENDAVWISAKMADPDDEVVNVTLDRWETSSKKWERITSNAIRTAAGKFFAQIPLRHETLLFRVSARDPDGGHTFKTCAVASDPANHRDVYPPLFASRKVRYPEFFSADLEASEVLAEAPSILLFREDGLGKPVQLEQTGMKTYRMVGDFLPHQDGSVVVQIEGVDPAGNLGRHTVGLLQQTILRGRSSQIEDLEGKASALFSPTSVYTYLYPTVEPFVPESPDDLPAIGDGHAFLPDDLPFGGEVTISLKYPEGLPKRKIEQLGVYYMEEETGGWTFLGNALDHERGQVSAQVMHFSRYALLLDEIPPSIEHLRPKHRSTIKTRKPLLSAQITDIGSGIGREENIVMEIDRYRVISEYDPERDRVSYQIKHPLRPGVHALKVTVRDRSGNTASAQSTFTVR